MNRSERNKIALAKVIILLIFFFASLTLINKIKMNCALLKNQKSIETNKIIDDLEIRTENFYLGNKKFKKKEKKTKASEVEKNKETKIKLLLKEEKKTEKETLLKGNYYIQIGTYVQRKNAEKKKKELERYGVEIIKMKMKNKIYYRVIINNIKDKKMAEAIINEINSDEKYLIRVRY